MIVDDIKRTFVTVPRNPGRQYQKAFIFLSGLTTSSDKQEQKDPFKEKATLFKDRQILIVLPDGLKETFPEEPEKLAWGPKHEEENRDYIRRLVEHLRTIHRIEEFVLGGFSNGAFFATDLFLDGDPAFKGYWIQGGGIANRKKGPLKKSRAVLEVGKKDKWHYDGVQRLRDQLIDEGWILGKNFLYRGLDGGHELNLDHIEEDLDFLFEPAPKLSKN